MSEDAYARKEGFPTKIVMAVLAGIVVTLWFVFGQGYMTSPLPAQSSEPPTIWIVYRGDLYTGLQGSYCWADKCVDKIFRSPEGAINVEKDSSIGLILNSLVRPSTIVVQVLAVDEQGSPLQIKELTNDGNDIYTVSLDVGTYALSVFASWKDLGDVNYVFKINVN